MEKIIYDNGIGVRALYVTLPQIRILFIFFVYIFIHNLANKSPFGLKFSQMILNTETSNLMYNPFYLQFCTSQHSYPVPLKLFRLLFPICEAQQNKMTKVLKRNIESKFTISITIVVRLGCMHPEIDNQKQHSSSVDDGR